MEPPITEGARIAATAALICFIVSQRNGFNDGHENYAEEIEGGEFEIIGISHTIMQILANIENTITIWQIIQVGYTVQRFVAIIVPSLINPAPLPACC